MGHPLGCEGYREEAGKSGQGLREIASIFSPYSVILRELCHLSHAEGRRHFRHPEVEAHHVYELFVAPSIIGDRLTVVANQACLARDGRVVGRQ